MTLIQTSKTRLSRRNLLAGLGASGMLLPLLNAQTTHAGPMGDGWPKRLIVVVSPNGVLPQTWFPLGTGTDYSLPESTQPLDPYKQDLIFLKGVNIQSFNDDGAAGNIQGGYNAHYAGPALLSGATYQPVGDKNVPTVITLDHYIANAIAAQAALPFRTLTLAGWYAGYDLHSYISFSEPTVPSVPEGSPYKLFETLFASGMLDALDLKDLRARRASILDFVGKDLERFGGRLGTDDRIKVEAHLAAIRAIEQQNSGDSGASCMPPNMVADLDPGKWENAPDLFRMQMDMMVAALACDQTRVITFHMDSQGDGGRWSWMGPEFQEPGDTYPDRSHHDVTHHENDDDAHRQRKTLAEQWYMQQLAYLIGRLKAVPEGTGSLLDHTAVMYINQMGSGSGHHTNSNPIVIAGSCGGYLKTGQSRDYTLKPIPHNGVLVALANAMGVPTETYGDPRYGGELTDIVV
jgi:hypothetical protein